MRLFYAVTFGGDTKSRLGALMDKIRPYCTNGRFSEAENLHLTLAFLGEVPYCSVADAKRAADETEAAPFSAGLNGLGRFKRSGGDIIWIGVKKRKELSEIYVRLCAALRKNGFKTDSRPYAPHVTLARQAVLIPGAQKSLDAVGETINFPVGGISLMKSERINGKLRYTEIYSKPLKGGEKT
ncbi:MAG TPA: RNA 2',3'-cyclic phosphodiesterase [Ruminococcaceae bacterium]|jgi:2'-5' RNA ligase|nr:RNA 2',3'-cyclic phosphodiesterase [Oscillospiraceae bacterium]